MKKVKILVVDDDPIVLDSCRRVFEAEGIEVYLVPSAEKALEAMENNDFAILLIDVKMPEQDGMYLMRKVKEKWPEVPIIVMSGYPTPETIAGGFQLGAAKFIAKPFTPDELFETVQQVLQEEKNHGTKKSSGNR
jgi:DNA-binding NtrC family response regulator